MGSLSRAIYPSKQYILELQVLSLFPCEVELDEVSVLYRECSRSESSGTSRGTSSGNGTSSGSSTFHSESEGGEYDGGVGVEGLMGSGSFRSSSLSSPPPMSMSTSRDNSHTNSHGIILHPGVMKTLSLPLPLTLPNPGSGLWGSLTHPNACLDLCHNPNPSQGSGTSPHNPDPDPSSPSMGSEGVSTSKAFAISEVVIRLGGDEDPIDMKQVIKHLVDMK